MRISCYEREDGGSIPSRGAITYTSSEGIGLNPPKVDGLVQLQHEVPICLFSLKEEHPPYKWDTAERYRQEVPIADVVKW